MHHWKLPRDCNNHAQRTGDSRERQEDEGAVALVRRTVYIPLASRDVENGAQAAMMPLLRL